MDKLLRKTSFCGLPILFSMGRSNKILKNCALLTNFIDHLRSLEVYVSFWYGRVIKCCINCKDLPINHFVMDFTKKLQDQNSFVVFCCDILKCVILKTFNDKEILFFNLFERLHSQFFKNIFFTLTRSKQ